MLVPSKNQTLYISVTNYGGSTQLLVNIGYNKTFPTVATASTADYVSSDLGGFERVIIAPTILHDDLRAEPKPAAFGDAKDIALPAPTTQTYALSRLLPTAEELAPLKGAIPTVDLWDGGRKIAVFSPEDEAHGPFLLKYHPSVMARYTALVDSALGRHNGEGILGDAAYCTNCPLFVSVYGLTSSYVSVQYTTGSVTEALKDDVQVFRSAPGIPGASYFT